MATPRSLRPILATFMCGALLLSGGVGCDVGGQPRRAPPIADPQPLWAAIPFERGECDTVDDLPADVARLLERASASSSWSLLVMGFANELTDLKENLRVAEDRARAVAKRLQLRGIMRDRIVIAWSEAPRDDDRGSRVEVVLVREPRRLV